MCTGLPPPPLPPSPIFPCLLLARYRLPCSLVCCLERCLLLRFSRWSPLPPLPPWMPSVPQHACVHRCTHHGWASVGALSAGSAPAGRSLERICSVPSNPAVGALVPLPPVCSCLQVPSALQAGPALSTPTTHGPLPTNHTSKRRLQGRGPEAKGAQPVATPAPSTASSRNATLAAWAESDATRRASLSLHACTCNIKRHLHEEA